MVLARLDFICSIYTVKDTQIAVAIEPLQSDLLDRIARAPTEPLRNNSCLYRKGNREQLLSGLFWSGSNKSGIPTLFPFARSLEKPAR